MSVYIGFIEYHTCKTEHTRSLYVHTARGTRLEERESVKLSKTVVFALFHFKYHLCFFMSSCRATDINSRPPLYLPLTPVAEPLAAPKPSTASGVLPPSNHGRTRSTIGARRPAAYARRPCDVCGAACGSRHRLTQQGPHGPRCA